MHLSSSRAKIIGVGFAWRLLAFVIVVIIIAWCHALVHGLVANESQARQSPNSVYRLSATHIQRIWSHAFGWPWKVLELDELRSFQYRTTSYMDANWEQTDLRFHNALTMRIGSHDLHLPLGIRWRVLLQTILCIGVPIIVIGMSASSLRRRQRGRFECIHCGYSLEGLATTMCPECGSDRQNSLK